MIFAVNVGHIPYCATEALARNALKNRPPDPPPH